MTSKRYRLNWLDAGKGLITASLTSLLVFIEATFESGSLSFDWKKVLIAFLSGGVGYLIKNYFSGEKLKEV